MRYRERWRRRRGKGRERERERGKPRVSTEKTQSKKGKDTMKGEMDGVPLCSSCRISRTGETGGQPSLNECLNIHTTTKTKRLTVSRAVSTTALFSISHVWNRTHLKNGMNDMII